MPPPPRRPSGGTNPAGTLTLAMCPPELGERISLVFVFTCYNSPRTRMHKHVTPCQAGGRDAGPRAPPTHFELSLRVFLGDTGGVPPGPWHGFSGCCLQREPCPLGREGRWSVPWTHCWEAGCAWNSPCGRPGARVRSRCRSKKDGMPTVAPSHVLVGWSLGASECLPPG